MAFVISAATDDRKRPIYPKKGTYLTNPSLRVPFFGFFIASWMVHHLSCWHTVLDFVLYLRLF